jgi:carboxyl-terminal processing protease
MWFSLGSATSQAGSQANSLGAGTAPTIIDNGCSQTLDAAENRTFNTQDIALLKALRLSQPCPVKVTMNATVAFVNNLLNKAFDDPYTYMISPEDASDLDDDSSGKTADFSGGGVGVVLQWGHAEGGDKRRIFTGHIFRVVDGSPAAERKIKSTNRLIAVDGKPVIGHDFQEVLKMVRGPIGTPVTLTIVAGRRIMHVHITRKAIISKPVFFKDLGDGITAIVISTYDVVGVPELVQKDLTATLPSTKAYVVDERGNPGGWVDECVASSQLFIRTGVILTEDNRVVGSVDNPQFSKLEYAVTATSATERTLTAGGKQLSSKTLTRLPYLLNGRPVVLLTDGASASCSEIFAGALKENYQPGPDWQGAIMIGTRTFGKGIGQTYVDGYQGSRLRVTAFQNLTPANHWLGDAHKKRIGLDPDIVVENPPDAFPYSKDDRQAAFAKQFLLNELLDDPKTQIKSPVTSSTAKPASSGFSATTQMSLPSS